MRRLAAEPPGRRDALAPEAKRAANEVEAFEASVALEASSPSRAVAELLSGLRRRCNVRGSGAIGESDFAAALSALRAFDVVLVMEWLTLAAPASDGGGGGGSKGGSEQQAGPVAEAGTEARAMLALLRAVLGPRAPVALTHQRPGIGAPPLATALRSPARAPADAAGTPQPQPQNHGGGSGAGEGPGGEISGAWALGGRGDEWRRRNVPGSVLARLAAENTFDLRLYEAAGALAQERALALGRG